MNSLRLSLSILLLFVLLVTTGELYAQDPGIPDTVRIGTASVNPYDKFAVPVHLTNDEELKSITIPLVINSFSGLAKFDSVTYTGSRLADPSVLDFRQTYLFATDTFSVDSIILKFELSSGNLLPADTGKLCDIWLTALFGGQVAIDSLGNSPVEALRLVSSADQLFTPQFEPGTIAVACNYVIGDVRQDGGTVNGGDYLGIWKAFYGCLWIGESYLAADLNCDRRVDMRDQVALGKYIFGNGPKCDCGTYSPSTFNDPGIPDTIFIRRDTVIRGVTDTIRIELRHDETVAGLALGFEWSGSARLDMPDADCSDCFSPPYGYYALMVRSYLCTHFSDGSAPDSLYFSSATTGGYGGGQSIPADIAMYYDAPVMPLGAGEATFRLIDFPQFRSPSMLVMYDGTAIIPTVVGGVTVVDPICGDANADRIVNIGDAVYLINVIFKSGPSPRPACAGDANGDEATNVGDAVYLINYFFKSGPLPVSGCCP